MGIACSTMDTKESVGKITFIILYTYLYMHIFTDTLKKFKGRNCANPYKNIKQMLHKLFGASKL